MWARMRAGRHYGSPARWRVAICAMTDDQQPFDDALRVWLRRQGHTILAGADATRAARLDAARHSDLCILLLGPAFGRCDPLASFTDAEREAAAAADVDFGKLLVFAQSEVERASVTRMAEQQEFIDRHRGFIGGTFQATARTPAEFVSRVQAALRTWRPTPAGASDSSSHPVQSIATAIMISSTGDLIDEREGVRDVLAERRIPAIDYLHAASEPTPPRDRVIKWARDCRAQVLILGPRYGYISPADGLGITEMEFATARAAGRPILAFLRADAETTLDLDQRQFVERVRLLTPPAQVVAFASTKELQERLRRGLKALERQGPALPTPVLITAALSRRWYQRQIMRWQGTITSPAAPHGKPLVQAPLLLANSAKREEPILPASMRHHTVQDVQSALTVDEALSDYSRLVITGASGSGKTVTLQWYAVQTVHALPNGASTSVARTPIFLRLTDYARERRAGRVSTLLDAITAEERRFLLAHDIGLGPQRPDQHSFWREDLMAGRGLVLLDGFDAVPLGEQNVIAEEVRRLARELPPESPIVVSSRDDGLAQSLSAQLPAPFIALEAQPLTSGQQQDLLREWIEALHIETARHTARLNEPAAGASEAIETETALQNRMTDLLLRLEADPIVSHVAASSYDEHTALREWAQSPLLLTLFAAVTEGADASMPAAAPLAATNATIFNRSLRLLLTQRDDHRDMRRLLVEKEQLLLQLARRVVLDERGETFTLDDVREIWEAECRSPLTARAGDVANTSNDETNDAPTVTAEELLQGLSTGAAVLVRVGADAYRFILPSFAAYFAARLLAAAPEERRLDLIRRRRLYGPWEDVSELLVTELDRLGRPSEADRVVQTLLEADSEPVAGSDATDSLRLALRRATRCQGGRAWSLAAGGPGPALGEAWSRIWRETDGKDPLSLHVDAMRAHAILGPAAAPFILDYLSVVGNAPNPTVDLFATIALRGLARGGDPEAQALRERKRTDAAAQRSASSGADTIVGLATNLDTLRQQLHSADAVQRSSAAITLQKYGRAAASIMPDLIEALSDPVQDVRLRMSDLMTQLGPLAAPALGPLVEVALNDYASMLVDSPGKVFRQLGPLAAPAIPVLQEALSSPEAGRRAAAAHLLREMGTTARPAKDALLTTMLMANDDLTSKYATQALARMGPDVAAEAFAIALRALDHNAEGEQSPADVDLQRRALGAIGLLGPDAAGSAISRITAIAGTAKGSTRRAAVQALGDLGPVAAAAVPMLRATLRAAEDEYDYDVILDALAKFGVAAASAEPEVRVALHAKGYFVRASALAALANMGPGVLTAADLEMAIDDGSHMWQGALRAAIPLAPVSATFVSKMYDALTRDDGMWRSGIDVFEFVRQIKDAGLPSGQR